MPHSIKIRGIQPPELATQPEMFRLQFWTFAAQIALKVKDRELAQGLDAHGDPLKPISLATRKRRRSAMTATGKGDPSAPPLMPARQKSRVRSLLAGRAFTTHAELYWRYDPFTGASFDEVLTYQKAEGRNVFGISDQGMAQVQREAVKAWRAWLKTGTAPTATGRALPAAALDAGQQTRIARIVAGSAEPNAGARAIETVKVGTTDTRFITRGIEAPVVKALKASRTRSGGMTGAEWRKFWTGDGTEGAAAGGAKAVKPKAPRPQVAAMRPAKRKLEPRKPRTFQDAFDAMMKSASSFDERRDGTAKLISEHSTPIGPATVHGMSTPEEFRQFEYLGIKWAYAAGREESVGFTIREVFRDRAQIPDRLLQATARYWYCNQENKDDAYWRARYKNFSGSNATGGDGEVMVYKGGTGMIRTVAHESGHNLATKVYGGTHPSPGTDYKAAIASDEPPVSEYATNSDSEDFAEACRLYVENRSKLKESHPKRFAVIDRLMKDTSYHG